MGILLGMILMLLGGLELYACIFMEVTPPGTGIWLTIMYIIGSCFTIVSGIVCVGLEVRQRGFDRKYSRWQS